MLRHDLAEPFADEIGIFLDRLADAAEDDARAFQFLAEGGRDRHRIEHRIDRDAAFRQAVLAELLDAREHLLLGDRDAEFLVHAQDFGIDLVEAPKLGLRLRLGVIKSVLIVDRVHPELCPIGRLQRQPQAICLEPPLQHPFRLVLLGRDEADGVLGETLGREILFDVGMETPFVRLVRRLIGFGVSSGHLSAPCSTPARGRGSGRECRSGRSRALEPQPLPQAGGEK